MFKFTLINSVFYNLTVVLNTIALMSQFSPSIVITATHTQVRIY